MCGSGDCMIMTHTKKTRTPAEILAELRSRTPEERAARCLAGLEREALAGDTDAAEILWALNGHRTRGPRQ